MNTIIEGAGMFIWPLGFCSILVVFLISERAIALITGRVVPVSLLQAVRKGEARTLKVSNHSAAGRIIIFWQEGARGEVLKSFARSELIKLQRGFFLIDSVVAAAPLLGLLGTVTGLAALFPQQGLPDSQTLTRGVGLALSTTMIGLCIAIPALVGSNWLGRRVEILSSQVDVLVESLEQQSK